MLSQTRDLLRAHQVCRAGSIPLRDSAIAKYYQVAERSIILTIQDVGIMFEAFPGALRPLESLIQGQGNSFGERAQ